MRAIWQYEQICWYVVDDLHMGMKLCMCFDVEKVVKMILWWCISKYKFLKVVSTLNVNMSDYGGVVEMLVTIVSQSVEWLACV